MQNIPVKITNFYNDTLWCFVAFGLGGFWFHFLKIPIKNLVQHVVNSFSSGTQLC